jgi:hypothetical protein
MVPVIDIPVLIVDGSPSGLLQVIYCGGVRWLHPKDYLIRVIVLPYREL